MMQNNGWKKTKFAQEKGWEEYRKKIDLTCEDGTFFVSAKKEGNQWKSTAFIFRSSLPWGTPKRNEVIATEDFDSLDEAENFGLHVFSTFAVIC